MGSLTSRPKPAVTPQPQIVYVPAPQPVAQPVPTVTLATPTPEQQEAEREQVAQEQREENLLRRDRGRSGTIRTGFRGVLSAVETASQKKTLLGQ